MNLTSLKEQLQNSVKIVLTAHHKPDGDAMGSSLGLYHFLTDLGHDVTVVVPNDYPKNLQWLPGNNLVIISEQNPRKAAKAIKAADLIFCLDFNDLKRINELGDLVKKASAKKIIIDHHLEPTDFAHYNLIDSTASSTCELVYRFICTGWDSSFVTKKIGYCLFTGLITDTGSFKFSAASGNVFRIAAHLIDLGVKHYEINDRLFNQNSLNKTKFLGYCLYEKLELLPEFKTGFMAISADELTRFKSDTGDTEGLVNYILGIEGVLLAVLIIDRTQIVKLSFRSTGTIPANELARDFFNGGGHRNAAGGTSNLSLTETIDYLKKSLFAFKEKIQ